MESRECFLAAAPGCDAPETGTQGQEGLESHGQAPSPYKTLRLGTPSPKKAPESLSPVG